MGGGREQSGGGRVRRKGLILHKFRNLFLICIKRSRGGISFLLFIKGRNRTYNFLDLKKNFYD